MNKEIPLINNYILFKVMGKKKYDPKYIEDATKRIEQILNDTREFDDWTQICFSMKDAVHAAATVYGRNSDELVHKLNGFVLEMVAKAVSNINKYDITFQKKTEKKKESKVALCPRSLKLPTFPILRWIFLLV